MERKNCSMVMACEISEKVGVKEVSTKRAIAHPYVMPAYNSTAPTSVASLCSVLSEEHTSNHYLSISCNIRLTRQAKLPSQATSQPPQVFHNRQCHPCSSTLPSWPIIHVTMPIPFPSSTSQPVAAKQCINHVSHKRIPDPNDRTTSYSIRPAIMYDFVSLSRSARNRSCYESILGGSRESVLLPFWKGDADRDSSCLYVVSQHVPISSHHETPEERLGVIRKEGNSRPPSLPLLPKPLNSL